MILINLIHNIYRIIRYRINNFLYTICSMFQTFLTINWWNVASRQFFVVFFVFLCLNFLFIFREWLLLEKLQSQISLKFLIIRLNIFNPLLRILIFLKIEYFVRIIQFQHFPFRHLIKIFLYFCIDLFDRWYFIIGFQTFDQLNQSLNYCNQHFQNWYTN